MQHSYSLSRIGMCKTRMCAPFGAISFQTGSQKNATTFLPITEAMNSDDIDLIQFHDLHPQLYSEFMAQEKDFWKWVQKWWVSCNLIDPRIQGNEQWGWEVTYVNGEKAFQHYGQHENKQTAINQMMDAMFKLIELDEIEIRKE